MELGDQSSIFRYGAREVGCAVAGLISFYDLRVRTRVGCGR